MSSYPSIKRKSIFINASARLHFKIGDLTDYSMTKAACRRKRLLSSQSFYPLLQNGKNGSKSIMTKEEMWDRLNTYEFPSIRPDDVREWFSENQDDESLAELLAQVCNRTACLMAESSESDDPWLEVIFYDWDELEEELVQECLTRLKGKGILPDAKGRYAQIESYMEKHGYRNGNGWWIKNEKNQT